MPGCDEHSNSSSKIAAAPVTMPLPHSRLRAAAEPGHAASQPQQQQYNNPNHQQLWQQFQRAHYAHMLHQDAFFFIAHLIMSAIHKRVLVTEREQFAFNVALALFSGGLLMLVFFRSQYRAARPHLVLTMHVLLTFIRAAVVNSMDSKQAVHFRLGLVARNTNSDDTDTLAQLRSNTNTPGHLLLTMLGVLGGPFRLFEMLGLQQPFRWHAVNALLYMVMHPLAALNGIRLAYSNTMFYLVHELHDLIAALVDALLSGLVGLPPLQQQTCSSCPGVVLYGTVCMFGSVAAPLYVMYFAEQAAFRRWCSRQAVLAPAPVSAPTLSAPAAAAAAVGGGERGSPPQQPPECEPRQQRGSGRGSRRGAQQQQQQPPPPQQQQLEQHLKLLEQQLADGSQHAAGAPCAHAWGSPLAVQHWLLRWLVHLLALCSLFLLCWLAANAFALLLLPRVLSRRQLAFFCPNRPYAPYLIAGEVYCGSECEL